MINKYYDIIIFGLILTTIDGWWISKYMLPKYVKWFDDIGVKMKVNWVPIILAYSIMILVYPLFIVNKNKKKELINAAIMGAFIYGLYGFTVAAIFPKYDMKFAMTEVLWGAFLYLISTYLTSIITNYIKNE